MSVPLRDTHRSAAPRAAVEGARWQHLPSKVLLLFWCRFLREQKARGGEQGKFYEWGANAEDEIGRTAVDTFIKQVLCGLLLRVCMLQAGVADVPAARCRHGSLSLMLVGWCECGCYSDTILIVHADH